MNNLYEKHINYVYEINTYNYNKLISDDICTNYGIYKSGNKKYINLIAEILYNYIINNSIINKDNLNDWILVIPSVNKNKGVRLVSILVNKIRLLLNDYYQYNFKICCTYIDNDQNMYDYSKVTNFDERNNLLNKNNIEFSENIDLKFKKILLIDDSLIYGVTIENNIKLLEKLNLNLDNLNVLVYIKSSKELLEKYSNFENILNYIWYYNKYNIDFNSKNFCEYFILNNNDNILTLKVILMFLKLNEIDKDDIINLLLNDIIFYKYFLNECILYNLNKENSIYYEKYMVYNNIYNLHST
jgi:hypoxanthine phosphoribosyltransferase